MRKLIVPDTLRPSKDIYYSLVTRNRRQAQPPGNMSFFNQISDAITALSSSSLVQPTQVSASSPLVPCVVASGVSSCFFL